MNGIDVKSIAINIFKGSNASFANAAEQKRIGREIQLQCFEDVPYIPLGGFFFAAAYRKDLTGVIKGGIPVFYNVKRTA